MVVVSLALERFWKGGISRGLVFTENGWVLEKLCMTVFTAHVLVNFIMQKIVDNVNITDVRD